MPASAPPPTWLKSSYSRPDGNCLEIALFSRHFVIRDSKAPLPRLTFTPAPWHHFLTTARR
jgi:hypothetical protein